MGNTLCGYCQSVAYRKVLIQQLYKIKRCSALCCVVGCSFATFCSLYVSATNCRFKADVYVCMYVCGYVCHVLGPGEGPRATRNVKPVRFRDPWPFRTHPSCFSSRIYLLCPHSIRTIEPCDCGGVYNRAVRRLHVVDIARMPRPVHYHGPQRWRLEAATIDPAG